MIDNFYQDLDDYKMPILENELSDEEVNEEIKKLKTELIDQVTVLGHHYQQDDIIQFADEIGDSLHLSYVAKEVKKKYTLFCGVHFMAETADLLKKEDQVVLLPDLRAGCSMADMAMRQDLEVAWDLISTLSKSERVTPITYINSSAELKAFVGERGGSICTSSNAKKIVAWALDQSSKLLFFPDQHLGRNTCFDLGVPLDKMVVYDPRRSRGGLSDEAIKRAQVILWYGYCSVHQGFNVEQIHHIRQKYAGEMKVIVHPECSFEVVRAADSVGSTAFIIDTIKAAPRGSKFAVGTEINLVNRIKKQMEIAEEEKEIISLSPYHCLCTTMYRIRPRWLLESFRSIKRGHPLNVVTVPKNVKANALKALEKMMMI